MSMAESLAYLSLVTVVCFAVILVMYLLHKNTENKHDSKTKAEKNGNHKRY